VCESLGIRHATASQLIKEQRERSSWTTCRQVDDIDENQNALISAIKQLKQRGEQVVLDGHFVLRRRAGVHEKINIDTFRQLMIRGVVLIEAPTAIIAERLLCRGDSTWGPPEIELFAQAESEHAAFVCQQLQVPLLKLSLPSETDVRRAIENLCSDQVGPSEVAEVRRS
jgi:adenylate kinase